MSSKIMKISLKIENETSNWKTKEYFIQGTHSLPFPFLHSILKLQYFSMYLKKSKCNLFKIEFVENLISSRRNFFLPLKKSNL